MTPQAFSGNNILSVPSGTLQGHWPHYSDLHSIVFRQRRKKHSNVSKHNFIVHQDQVVGTVVHNHWSKTFYCTERTIFELRPCAVQSMHWGMGTWEHKALNHERLQATRGDKQSAQTETRMLPPPSPFECLSLQGDVNSTTKPGSQASPEHNG